ncbi:MAG: hypothetical protein ACR2FN_09180 [Chitinophagaceae bacterium]
MEEYIETVLRFLQSNKLKLNTNAKFIEQEILKGKVSFQEAILILKTILDNNWADPNTDSDRYIKWNYETDKYLKTKEESRNGRIIKPEDNYINKATVMNAFTKYKILSWEDFYNKNIFTFIYQGSERATELRQTIRQLEVDGLIKFIEEAVPPTWEIIIPKELRRATGSNLSEEEKYIKAETAPHENIVKRIIDRVLNNPTSAAAIGGIIALIIGTLILKYYHII